MGKGEWPQEGRELVVPSYRGQDAAITVFFREIFFSRSTAAFIQKRAEKVRAELFGLHLSCKGGFCVPCISPELFVFFHYSPLGECMSRSLVQTKLCRWPFYVSEVPSLIRGTGLFVSTMFLVYLAGSDSCSSECMQKPWKSLQIPHSLRLYV